MENQEKPAAAVICPLLSNYEKVKGCYGNECAFWTGKQCAVRLLALSAESLDKNGISAYNHQT